MISIVESQLNLAAEEPELEKEFYFEDRAMESVQTVSGILCFVAQTKWTEFVNKGPYGAMVNEDECFGERGGDSGGKGSQAKQDNLTPVIVHATREEKKAAKITVFFMDDEEGPGMATAWIAEGPSEENPVGIFYLEWPDGYLESRRNDDGKVVINFRENSDGEHDGGKYTSERSLAALLHSEDGKITAGAFTTEFESTWTKGTEKHEESGSYDVAYNESTMLRKGKDGKQCLSLTDLKKDVWDYTIVESSTNKVPNINSGFPIKFADGSHGHVGYWGVWTPDDVSISDGTKVKKDNYGEESSEEYTIVMAPGKLFKHTKESLEVKEIDGVNLFTWDNTNNKDVRVEYKHADGKFYITGERDQDGKQDQYKDVQHSEFSLPEYGAHFWSNNFNGNINIWKEGSSINVVATKQVDVTASENNLDLICIQNCLPADITDSIAKSMQNSWQEPSYDNAVTYKFSNLQLTRDASVVKLNSDVSSDANLHLQTGNLLTKTVYEQLKAQNPSSPWKLGDSSTYYTYQTGTESWNKFSGVKDAAGKFVKFDAPLRIKYKHSKEYDRNNDATYAGQIAMLEFGGQNLWGIPHDYDEDTKRHRPLFSIKDGAQSVDGKYKIYGLRGSLYPSELDDEKCADLNTSDLPDLPTGDAEDAPEFKQFSKSQFESLIGKSLDEIGMAVSDGVVQK